VRQTQGKRPTSLSKTFEEALKANPPTSWAVVISESGRTTAVIGPFAEERLANDYRLDLLSLDLVGQGYTVIPLHNPD
jgi:hypothetical protein